MVDKLPLEEGVPSRHRALTEGQSQRMMGAPRGTQGG